MMSCEACAMMQGTIMSPEFLRRSSGSAESTETHTGSDFWLLISTTVTSRGAHRADLLSKKMKNV